jgi:ABC-type polysaccharide/polyol phosphate export permease
MAFLLGMADHMTFKVTINFKLFITLGTAEWFFICMGSNMACQILLIDVFFLAKTALKRNFPCMSTHMNDKIAKYVKTFCTKITFPNPGIGLIRC